MYISSVLPVPSFSRNFEEKRLTGTMFLDMAKPFDTVWVDDHIRALTEGFDSKLAEAGNPWFGNSAGICADRGLTSPTQSAKLQCWWLESVATAKTAPSKNESCPAANFPLPWLRSFRDFSSVVRRMPGYNAKTWHGPHSPPGMVAWLKCLHTVTYLRLRLCHSGFNTKKSSNQSMPNPLRKFGKLLLLSLLILLLLLSLLILLLLLLLLLQLGLIA
jgi:hypothetical protein